MNKAEKAQKIKNYEEAVETADFAILTEFGKTPVTEVEKIRGQLRNSECNAVVMKNTLARIVFERQEIEEITEYLVGPTMMFYGKEEIAPTAKFVQKLSKKHPAIKVKAIMFDGKIYGKEDFSTFTAMPTKLELRGSFASVILAPITLFVRVVNTPQRLVNVLKSYADKSGS